MGRESESNKKKACHNNRTFLSENAPHHTEQWTGFGCGSGSLLQNGVCCILWIIIIETDLCGANVEIAYMSLSRQAWMFPRRQKYYPKNFYLLMSNRTVVNDTNIFKAYSNKKSKRPVGSQSKWVNVTFVFFGLKKQTFYYPGHICKKQW